MNKTMTVRPLLVLAAVLSFMVAMFVGGGAQASVIDSKPYVDTITFDKTSMQNGESASVAVTFSEKNGNKFKSGDTFTMTLPKELRGYKSTLQLGDYGTAVVNGDSVVVTFNDKVDSKQNVKGGFKFTLSAVEELGEGQSKVLDTTFGTDAKSTEVTLNGRASNPGTGEGEQPTDLPFGYKGGRANMDNPSDIDWYIVANTNRANLNADIVVTDTLKGGQAMKANTLTINGVSVAELVAQGNATYEETDTSFKLVVKQAYANGQSLNITYTTTTTEAGKKMKEYKNDFNIDFQLEGGQPDSIKGEGSAQNMSGDGFADGDEQEKPEEPEIIDPIEPTEEVNPEETTEPIEPVEPEVVEPEVVEPETTEPEVTEPEVVEPETTNPENNKNVESKKNNKNVAPKAVSPKHTEVKGAELPHTGSEDNKFVGVLGLVLMSLAGLMIRRRAVK